MLSVGDDGLDVHLEISEAPVPLVRELAQAVLAHCRLPNAHTFSPNDRVLSLENAILDILQQR